MLKIVTVLLILAPAIVASGQPLKELYRETLELKDTALQMKILTGWEEMRPNDPELCLAYAEHYYKQSRRRRAKVDSLPCIGIRATLLDDTSPRSFTKFFPIKVDYLDAPFAQAIDYLSRGIAANPDHIDLRMLKIAYLMNYRTPSITQDILDLLTRAKLNKGAWLVQDSLLWDAQDTLLPFLQRTMRHMYTTQLVGHIDIGKIAAAILEQYPNHHQSLIELGRSYYLSHDFQTALIHFKRAEEIMPHSLQATGHIALCYYYLGEPTNSVIYFHKFKEYGDEDDRKFADERIGELQNK